MPRAGPRRHPASVASFFLSRIDVLVDPILEELIAGSGGPRGRKADELRGEVAIASAKHAYQIYKEIFQSQRFRKLAARGPAPSDCSGPAPAPRTRITAM